MYALLTATLCVHPVRRLAVVRYDPGNVALLEGGERVVQKHVRKVHRHVPIGGDERAAHTPVLREHLGRGEVLYHVPGAHHRVQPEVAHRPDLRRKRSGEIWVLFCLFFCSANDASTQALGANHLRAAVVAGPSSRYLPSPIVDEQEEEQQQCHQQAAAPGVQRHTNHTVPPANSSGVVCVWEC